jgi:3-methylfumaryl-CoA hydratase
MLFRYSAVTMNSHRIHYDRDYTTRVEGYPGLLVHGPLIMTLLLDLFRRELPRARLATFAARAVSPLYDTAAFEVQGEPGPDGRSAKVWALNPEGGLAMAAEATYAG